MKALISFNVWEKICKPILWSEKVIRKNRNSASERQKTESEVIGKLIQGKRTKRHFSSLFFHPPIEKENWKIVWTGELKNEAFVWTQFIVMMEWVSRSIQIRFLTVEIACLTFRSAQNQETSTNSLSRIFGVSREKSGRNSVYKFHPQVSNVWLGT